MPVALIPLTQKQLSNSSPVAVSNGTVQNWDCYLDEYGYIHKRPGLSSFVDLGTSAPIDGLYYWLERDVTIAISAGEVFSINNAGTATSLGVGMERDVRVSFATCNPGGTNTLIMANGGRMWKTTGGAISQITDVDAPTNVTTVAFLDQYILANNANTPRFYYSSVNDPDTWSALDFVTAETKADNVSGLFTTYEELLVIGTSSIERYYNDGSTPFVQRRGAYVDMGSISPYTFCKVGGVWIFLNYERKVVQMSGAEFQIISADIDAELQAITSVENARADIININGRSFYVISFPTSGLTFMYDYKLNTWSRWGRWNSTTSSYDLWLGSTHTYSSKSNKHFVGSRIDGKIYLMDDSYAIDGTDEIRASVRTGYFDHGSMVRKRSKRVRFRAKKGYGSAASKVMFRHRDDDGQEWEERQIDFALADYDVFNIQNQMGMYRARQYEVVMTDNAPFLLGQFEEEFEPMMR